MHIYIVFIGHILYLHRKYASSLNKPHAFAVNDHIIALPWEKLGEIILWN